MASARKPIASDSTRATTPRMTGSRIQRWRTAAESSGRWTRAIWPFGRRTATAQADGLRIITPSITACPPTLLMPIPSNAGGSGRACPVRRVGALGAGRGARPAAVEALDAATRVDQLLLAGVERVA